MHRTRIFAIVLPVLVVVVATATLFRALYVFADEPHPSPAVLDTATAPEDVIYPVAVNLPMVVVPEKYPADNRAFELELLRLINEQRALMGLSPLTEQAPLTQAARRHAIDMATNNLFSHTGSDGSEPEQRMVQEGYTGTPWGEAAGFSVSPERAMALAMGSDPHRGIILDPQASDVGIGFALRQGHHAFVIDTGH